MTWDDVRRVCVSLEGTEESTSYGTPAMKVDGTHYARLHQDGENLVLRIAKSKRPKRIREQPAVFHVTDHYREHPYVLAKLAAITEQQLADALHDAWKSVAGSSGAR